MHSPNPRHGTLPSLWLLPGEPQLSDLLRLLAAAHGGPRFAPHLTLLGSVPGTPEALADLGEQLAARIPAMRLATAGVSASRLWFRCLFLNVSPSAELLAARAEALHLAGMPDRPFTPHLSLLYGDLPAETRSLAILGLPPMPASIHLTHLALVRTVGPAQDWIELRRWALTPGSRR
jgi:2'-5' RNA ligase